MLSDEESSASTDLPGIYLKNLSNKFDNALQPSMMLMDKLHF